MDIFFVVIVAQEDSQGCINIVDDLNGISFERSYRFLFLCQSRIDHDCLLYNCLIFDNSLRLEIVVIDLCRELFFVIGVVIIVFRLLSQLLAVSEGQFCNILAGLLSDDFRESLLLTNDSAIS